MNTAHPLDVLILGTCGIAAAASYGKEPYTMTNLPSLFLGAALVVLGVLASALADRIRGGLRMARREPQERQERASARPAKAGTPTTPARTEADLAMERDAVLMLVHNGIGKKDAQRAVAEVPGTCRGSMEALVRAALKRFHPNAQQGAHA